MCSALLSENSNDVFSMRLFKFMIVFSFVNKL